MTDGQKALIDRLRLKGYGYSKIAKEIGVSKNTVKSYCRRSKTNGKAQESIAICEQCGKSIDTSKRSASRFCSDACRSIWWNKHPKTKIPYSTSCACCGKKIHTHNQSIQIAFRHAYHS